MDSKPFVAVNKNLSNFQSREAVEDAIKTLLGDHTSKDNLLSYFNGRLNSISTSLSQKQQNLTKLGQKGATIEANLRNARSSLEKKQTTLNGMSYKNSQRCASLIP